MGGLVLYPVAKSFAAPTFLWPMFQAYHHNSFISSNYKLQTRILQTIKTQTTTHHKLVVARRIERETVVGREPVHQTHQPFELLPKLMNRWKGN